MRIPALLARSFSIQGCAVFLFTLLSACHAAKEGGVSLTLSYPLLAFMQSQSGGSGMNGIIADFPAMEIFNRDGRLIYLSHNVGENIAMLRSLPSALNHLNMLPGQPDLAHLLGTLPGLTDDNRGAILASRRATVVSFDLEACESCEQQEQALSPVSSKLLISEGMNLIVIRVTRPH